MSERSTKQVIVIRKDLNMRRGKEIAQGSHAAMAWLAQRVEHSDWGAGSLHLTQAQKDWIEGSHAKVTLQVSSEQELLEVYHSALNAGLEAILITDAGLTEFDGVPTNTCLAIGPDYCDAIDPVTSKLKLY